MQKNIRARPDSYIFSEIWGGKMNPLPEKKWSSTCLLLKAQDIEVRVKPTTNDACAISHHKTLRGYELKLFITFSSPGRNHKQNLDNTQKLSRAIEFL